MSLEDLVQQSKGLVSALISKPKMAEKLLMKPPFRFLHDLMSAVVNTTGFGEGLMSGDELESASISDKGAKIAYLDKWFTFVGICKVRKEVRSVSQLSNRILIAHCHLNIQQFIDSFVAALLPKKHCIY